MGYWISLWRTIWTGLRRIRAFVERQADGFLARRPCTRDSQTSCTTTTATGRSRMFLRQAESQIRSGKGWASLLPTMTGTDGQTFSSQMITKEISCSRTGTGRDLTKSVSNRSLHTPMMVFQCQAWELTFATGTTPADQAFS